MATGIANTTASGELFNQQGGKMTAPAFLDLADSAARQSSNLPDINMQRLEQRRAEFERQRQHTRKAFEDQMRKMDQLQIEEERKLLSVTPDPNGHQHVALSAPTTPPRNAASIDTSVGTQTFNALVSPVILTNGQRTMGSNGPRGQDNSGYRPGLGLGNIPGGFSNNENTNADSNRQPMAGAKSMPGSRRGSKNKDDPDFLNLAGLSLQDRTPSAQGKRDPSADTGKAPNAQGAMSPVFNDKFLLDDELDKEMLASVAQYPDGDDQFPILVRRDSYPGRLSVASAALDLAPLSQAPQRNFGEIGSKTSEWPQFSGPTRAELNTPIARMDRGRAVTQPQLNMKNGQPESRSSIPSLSPSGAQQLSPVDSRRSSPPGPRDGANGVKSLSSSRSVPGTPLAPLPGNGGMAVQRPSVSPGAGDIPQQMMHVQNQMYAQQQEMNAAYSRGSLPNNPSYTGSTLSFGSITQSNSMGSGYGNGSYGSTPLSAPYDFDNEPHMYGPRYNLGGRSMPGEHGKMNGLHGPKHKRGDLDLNRFAGTRLEDLVGEIPSLCKDQHGCRYLQKKLEEGIPEHRDMIFRETFGHFADLMTDPFGNYLCQKLLEFATDEQRNLICESVALDLVGISLNMHGTRAVQKMIDYLSTPRQIHAIIIALSMNVVTLIKDLNGNHVIQKCLNRLVPEDNQFIYNAVAAHCVEVATHRHGCCVLQRCIDHASEAQRMQLVNEITYNALTLVQDPYGNYVVQYILDLNDNRFSDGVIRQFIGNVIPLSMQKFSSNVIEKCIRVAEPTTRKMLVEEFLNRAKLEKLLRDSFGNYCVQTALDYAEPPQRMALVEGIRPILPLIRNTPYGKRIQSKLQREQMEGLGGQFGSYHHPAAQQALVNLAMANGINPQMQQPQQSHGLGQRNLHHAASMSELYNGPSPMGYPLGQPGLPPQRQQQQLHGQQLAAPGLEQYGSHLQTSPSGSLLGVPHGAGGYGPSNGYSNHSYGAPGNNLGLPAGEAVYAQHGGYNYM